MLIKSYAGDEPRPLSGGAIKSKTHKPESERNIFGLSNRIHRHTVTSWKKYLIYYRTYQVIKSILKEEVI